MGCDFTRGVPVKSGYFSIVYSHQSFLWDKSIDILCYAYIYIMICYVYIYICILCDYSIDNA